MREMNQALPGEDIVYFGDTARLPYGTKSKETITRFSMDNVNFLQDFDIKLVVAACNTASALSLEALKNTFSMPIIGVIEPGARHALSQTKNGKVGVIGTRSTIGSGSYEASLKSLDPNARIYSEACPLFVPFVEEGWLDGDVVRKVAQVYLSPLKSFGIDTLILGCTHYPLLTKVIQEIMGDSVRLVNSAQATADEARKLLEKLKLTSNKEPQLHETKFYVSDEPEQFRTLGERFLGKPIQSVAKVGDHVRSSSTG